MIRGFAFDFDGVLVGLDAHTEARLGAFDEFATSTGDERYLVDPAIHAEAHQHGSYPNTIIGWILQHQGLVPPDYDPATDPLVNDVVTRKKELYLEAVYEGLDALDGSIECVQWAAETFGPPHVAITTTASIHEVMPFLHRHNVSGYVGVLITKEIVGQNLKPHPLAYDLTAREFVLEPTMCIAIEDSPRGLASANSAGFNTIGITTTHTEDQLELDSDFIVHTFDEVPELVSGNLVNL